MEELDKDILEILDKIEEELKAAGIDIDEELEDDIKK